MLRLGFFLYFVFSSFFLLNSQNTTLAQSQTNSERDPIFRELPAIMQLLFGSCTTKTFPLNYGRWVAPENTLTLPPKADGEGYYYKDIQASFPGVDWQELDRLYIPAGNYKFIRIANLPVRESSRPLVITNIGGQVRVGEYGHYYLFNLSGGKNWVLTGRYDPLSQTGDAGYPGHWGGKYANSRGTYGILVTDNMSGPSGLAVGGSATDFELEFIEVREVGFAGMTIKTDDDGTATMENVKIHDNYIHDTLSEGFYIGSTQSQPQHLIRKMEIYNNRLIRNGTEAIQIGNLGGEVNVHNNVFALSAVHWKDAFQQWQDGNLQLDNRTGNVTVSDNIFIGAAGNMVFLTGDAVAGDSYPASSTVLFSKNYFSSTRNQFFYIRNDQFSGLNYLIKDNYFTHMDYQRDEIGGNVDGPSNMITSFTPAPLVFASNIWKVSQNFSNRLADGNGTYNNVSGYDNLHQPPPQLQFCNIGLARGFDWLKVEVWAENAGRATVQPSPITYEHDDIVMHFGKPYRCKLNPCPKEKEPPSNPDVWAPLSYPADDWRLRPGTGLDGLGLSY